MSGWQQPSDWHLRNQHATQWPKPETDIQVWKEQPSQWVNTCPASDNTTQQWIVSSRAIPQQSAQQACGQPAWVPTTQTSISKQPSSLQDYRLDQLEIALKEQQEQRHKAEAVQRESNQMQFMRQQLEDWQAWKEREDSSYNRRDHTPVQQPPPASQVQERSMPMPPESSTQPALSQPSQGNEAELPAADIKTLFSKILSGLEVLLEGQSASSSKKRSSPSPSTASRPKRTSYSVKTCERVEENPKPLHHSSKQTRTLLPQKHKANPLQPPWIKAANRPGSDQRRQPSASTQPARRPVSTAHEIVPVT